MHIKYEVYLVILSYSTSINVIFSTILIYGVLRHQSESKPVQRPVF
jgi:hypothetical protein